MTEAALATSGLALVALDRLGPVLAVFAPKPAAIQAEQ